MKELKAFIPAESLEGVYYPFKNVHWVFMIFIMSTVIPIVATERFSVYSCPDREWDLEWLPADHEGLDIPSRKGPFIFAGTCEPAGGTQL